MIKNLTIIAAVSSDNIIGKDGDLPWHCSDDLKHFNKVTRGHTVVMGRKTFKSLPNGLPLRHRENIVLTSGDAHDGFRVASTIPEILGEVLLNRDKRYFIIGGASVYRTFLPYANEFWLTEIKCNVSDDGNVVKFPIERIHDSQTLHKIGFKTVLSEESGKCNNGYEYSIKLLKRA